MENEYYITTIDENGEPVIYESERFRFSEMEILNLIKICILEKRSIMIGKKILDIYIDSNPDQSYVNKKLNMIGIVTNEKPKPKILRRPKIK